MPKRSSLVHLLQACSWSILLAGMAMSADGVEHHGSIVNSAAGYRECLTCHDGVVATDVSPCLGPVCMLKNDHPVDRTYPPRDKARDFAPAAVAEGAGVRFIDGRIDCISCHDLHNAGRFHLRIEERNSRLCLACHLR